MMGSSRLGEHSVDVGSDKLPAWVKHPPMPWVDIRNLMPWLRPLPYLAGTNKASEVYEVLTNAGVIVLEVQLQGIAGELERSLLRELSKALGFPPEGSGSWLALKDRLEELLTGGESEPMVVLFTGLDRFLNSDIHAVLSFVHFLHSVVDGISWSNEKIDRQVEFIFIGEWPGLDDLPRSA
jgi:hypothetical protein